MCFIKKQKINIVSIIAHFFRFTNHKMYEFFSSHRYPDGKSTFFLVYFDIVYYDRNKTIEFFRILL